MRKVPIALLLLRASRGLWWFVLFQSFVQTTLWRDAAWRTQRRHEIDRSVE